jgi:hypothetical protein
VLFWQSYGILYNQYRNLHHIQSTRLLTTYVVDNVKSSGSVQEMEHLFDDLTKNIKTIIASGQDNSDVLNETKACIEKKIKQTRLAINCNLMFITEQINSDDEGR